MDNNLRIINYLGKHIGKSFTMHELSKLISIPISLNIINPIVKSYLAISSDEERKEYTKEHLIIRKIAAELNTNDIVILFGSYAKGSETERSDIDVLVINKDGKKSLSFSRYEVLFKKKINPIFITSSEFKKMLQDKEENIGKQALKSHVILNNPERFWGLVLDGVR